MSQIDPFAAQDASPGRALAEMASSPEVQDLVFSYLRIRSPSLRRAAVSSIRALAEASRSEPAAGSL